MTKKRTREPADDEQLQKPHEEYGRLREEGFREKDFFSNDEEEPIQEAP